MYKFTASFTASADQSMLEFLQNNKSRTRAAERQGPNYRWPDVKQILKMLSFFEKFLNA
jgi:hypothetical protein